MVIDFPTATAKQGAPAERRPTRKHLEPDPILQLSFVKNKHPRLMRGRNWWAVPENIDPLMGSSLGTTLGREFITWMRAQALMGENNGSVLCSILMEMVARLNSDAGRDFIEIGFIHALAAAIERRI